MIVEELSKLDDSKRKVAAVLTVLAVAGLSYLIITRGSVVKLKTARTNYAELQAIYERTENQIANFSNLQKQLEEKQKQLQEYEQWYFSEAEAMRFFEYINSMVISHNLRPISRTISDPTALGESKTKTEDSETERPVLKKQSANVAVTGNYFNIVHFLNELVDRPQKICLTNFRINLARGEKYHPRASFKITLLIDSSKGQKI